MNEALRSHLNEQFEQLRSADLFKQERVITSPQQAHITTEGGDDVINMCANNYLGLANHPEVIDAARNSYDAWGFGLSSVRFICGTQQIHRQLENAISEFLGTEDTILYTSCFDANGGLFEPLLATEDAVISDSLNHASIIDGIRLCKAHRLRYEHGDMGDLEAKLEKAGGARHTLIATDGVFSMDGHFADLATICDLAERHDAVVMVDDSHAVGFVGERGRGTCELLNVEGRVDIITGTLGKALGGASGGYTSGCREIIALLRQRSRPYLFSNTLAPSIVAASLKAVEIIGRSQELRHKLESNTALFRKGVQELGLTVQPGTHPIVPIMLGEATTAQEMARRMLDRGVYVIGFFYPVVPEGTARIRTQVSAAHSEEDLYFVLDKFGEVIEDMGL